MKMLKILLLAVVLFLFGTPGVFSFIAVLVCLFKGDFVSAVVCLVISLPLLYIAKMCFSVIDEMRHPKKYPEKEGDKNDAKNENGDAVKENVEQLTTKIERGYKPEYEIRYVSADGYESVRQIYVHAFKGRYISAYCFLRHEDRTFVVSRIVECVDLETGELITQNLHIYFNEKFHTNFKMSEMF